MLWFIKKIYKVLQRVVHLNTSYVMVHHYHDFESENNKSLFKYILCYGSSFLHLQKQERRGVFKYILCYGSSSHGAVGRLGKRYLNTSYVMVHLKKDCFNLYNYKKFKYILCYGSSLKSPRLRVIICLFKYILCYGSSNL